MPKGTQAPEQLRAPPHGLLPAAAGDSRPLPRCAAPGARAEPPLQLQGHPGRVTTPLRAPPPNPADRMEPPDGADPGEIVNKVGVPQAVLGTTAHGTGDCCPSPVAEEEVGIPVAVPGLLQVTERRQPLSSVSSLEVHFDLLDLTELTDMSDQELAEVFADSDDENLTSESPGGSHLLPRASCLRSPSWTRTRPEQNREKQPLGDPERHPEIVDTFLTVEREQQSAIVDTLLTVERPKED